MCSNCDFRNLHNGHKLISIDDEELLKKENISLDSSINEFNKYIEKIKNLEQKIENEIIEINKAYENIDKEITKTYEEKHQILLLEENNLKENLQNEVTKIKEKLEYFLTDIKNILRINERINKGIKLVQNEEEKNIIKILSYVSKISKIEKKAKTLLGQIMKNIKINFNIDKCDIKFKEYYFSGIHIPKNIEFKDITPNSFKIFWKLDNIIIKNIDINKYIFIVEIRKENSTNDFTKVYQGKDSNCLINNLDGFINYEIRICSSFNDLYGSWSKIKKVKTDYIDDSIILNTEDKIKLLAFLNPLFNGKKFNLKLIYRRGNDMSYETFHKKCDKQGKTITICKSKEQKFGGYTNFNWESFKEGKVIYEKGPFIFSINKNKKYDYSNKKNNSVYLYANHGPDFYWDLVFNSEKQMKICKCCPKNYGYAYSNEPLIGDGSLNEIEVDEVETFKIEEIN